MMTELASRTLPRAPLRPPILPPDEVFGVRPSPYVQECLALDFDPDDEMESPRTLRQDLPDPEPLVVQLAQALVEVMAGLRPPQQLAKWASPEVYDLLCRRSHVAARRPAVSRRPAVVRRVRVQEPADGIVEACAVVVHHDRVRALALRMSGWGRRWIVTELQIG